MLLGGLTLAGNQMPQLVETDHKHFLCPHTLGYKNQEREALDFRAEQQRLKFEPYFHQF